MKHIRAILSTAVAGLTLAVAPAALRAESAAPNDDAANFLNNVNCPDPDLSTTGCFDPNAAGTKYSASLSVVYDKGDTLCDSETEGDGLKLHNVFFNLTLQQANSSAIATTDYKNGVRPHTTGPICFGSIEVEQAKTVIDLIREKALPLLNCTVGSCTFKIKSVTNFQYTAGDDPTSGGFSVDMTIAVK